MSERPKVSVIIPSYNSEVYLPDAISSVLAQTLPDFEIIVVNDGSTDHSEEVIARFGDQIKYFSQKNRGVGAARNTGIKYSQGQYIAFLDADDLLLPRKLETQASYLDEHPDIDIVYSDGYLFRTDALGREAHQLFSKCGLLNTGLGAPPESLRILAIENAFPIHAALVRRECLEDSGGFDEDRDLMSLEDWDLWYRLGNEHRFAYQDGFVAKYRMAETGLSRSTQRVKKASEVLECKIEHSSGFLTLPQLFRSNFYFYWGILWLELGERHVAIDHFRKAIQRDPRNLYARSAYLLARMLGQRAVVFYHLKRRFLGADRLPGL